RPRGMLMLGAVFAVAVLGAGGLFAYKALGGRGLGGEPPLIRADVEPVKTTPEPTADSGQRNKAVYDRVDDAKRQSKVVTREEQPVDLPAAPSAAPRVDGARVILPGGDKTTVAPATGGDEPRRVKTMTIRPDGAVAAAPQSAPAPAAPVRTAESDPIAELARTGQAPASEFNDGIMSEAEPARPASRATQPAPQRPAPQQAAPRPAPVAQARPAPQPAPAPQQQVAAVAPRAQVPAPAATTPARATPGGAYVVQVTSQRSEQDARAAYSSLQKKFPSVLGSYQASIQTATVPDRGTYYRVRVGPFTSSTDASTLCSSLRSAGGDCVVSRN
ncbi:MAG: SPOR domain-containing protein, partial [Hansschlegelia sp.]